MDLGTAITTVGLGAPTIIGIIIAIFKWSLGRNVEHEDNWKKDVTERLKTLEDEKVKAAQDAIALRGEVRAATEGVGRLSGSVHELVGNVQHLQNTIRDSQREELERIAQMLRQEFSRHIHPELPEKVAKLEATVSTLARQPVRRRSR